MSVAAILQFVRKNPHAEDIFVSISLIVIVLLLRTGLLRLVRRHFPPGDSILRGTAMVKRGAIMIIFIGLVLLWGTELRTMALSLTAIAVALVIATKEMLLCVMGSVLRASAKSFSVGDRIELAGVRGDVVDHGLFATTIIEVGPGHRWTGRAVTLPNSVMLTSAVINETYSHPYVLHVFRVPIADEVDPVAAEAELVAAANEVCEPFYEEASRALTRDAKERGLEPPITAPHVIFQIPEAGERDLLVRLPVVARDKGDIEQAIIRRFLSWLRS
jgi:small-conductance mechanosensitive channel